MNEVATRNDSQNNNLPMNPPRNHFTQAGAELEVNTIVGDRLKFNKGDYIIVSKDHPLGLDLPVGTEVIANMDSLIRGWVRWEDEKPTEQLMGLVCEGFAVAKRSTLGDMDKALWEQKPGNDKPTDPWSFTHQLVLQNLKTGALYTFGSSSWGGKACFELLLKSYGGQMSMHEKEWPVLKLEVLINDHPDYGRQKKPSLPIVKWVSKSEFADPETGEVKEKAQTKEVGAQKPRPSSSPETVF